MAPEKDIKMMKEEVLDHYRNPRNRGTMAKPDFTSGQHNPSCGDSVCMQGRVTQGTLCDVAFESKGCVISQATASLLSEACKGKKLSEVLEMNQDALLKLLGIPLGPTRLKCALLPLMALQQGVNEYQKVHGVFLPSPHDGKNEILLPSPHDDKKKDA